MALIFDHSQKVLTSVAVLLELLSDNSKSCNELPNSARITNSSHQSFVQDDPLAST
jgi:hypothetical protein